MYEIGIIVLNYNNYKLTQKCVDNIISIDAPVDILIVDNHSQNDSFSQLKHYYAGTPVRVLCTDKNGGYAYGNNYGAKCFDKDENIKYICIMNPDVDITYPDLFLNLKTILDENEKIGVVTAKMLLRGEERIQNMFWKLPVGLEVATEIFELSNRKPNTIENVDLLNVDVVPGSFFMIKKETFKTVGYMDENTFLYDEENILSIKLKRCGFSEAISLKDFYVHNHQKKDLNLTSRLKKKTIGYNSRRYMCSRYYGKKERMLLELIIFANYPIIIVKHFKKRINTLFSNL